MFKHANTLAVGEYASALTGVLVAVMTGARAAEGMSAAQWTGGLTAVLASIAWAVMVRVWPLPARRRA